MKSKGHDHTVTRIFTGSELKAATTNYAEDMKIGTGGFGAVYEGKLETGMLVAIKKAQVPGNGDNKEFLNEVMILTQIHHKHIVKLLGCCLETKTPLLVYKHFIHHIKSEGKLEEIIDPRIEIVDNSASISQEQAWRIRSSILGIGSVVHRCLALIGNDRPSMMEVEQELHEISRKLHAIGSEGVGEESLALLQSYEVGAVIMENNEYVIHSNSYSQMDGSKIYGMSTQLPR